MLINKDKTEYQNILDHINLLIPSTESPIQEGEISFSNPEVIPGEDLSLIPNTHPNDSYIYNTIITVLPAPQFSWELPTTVEYRRVDLGKQYLIWKGEEKGSESNPITFKLTKEQTQNDIETQAALDFLLFLLPFLRVESLVCQKVEVKNNELVRFKVTPITNSLLYIGELYINGRREANIIPPPSPTPTKIPLDEVFTPNLTDSDNTKANEGDGFDYFEQGD